MHHVKFFCTVNQRPLKAPAITINSSNFCHWFCPSYCLKRSQILNPCHAVSPRDFQCLIKKLNFIHLYIWIIINCMKQLTALRACLTSSFAPFRRSGRVTHAMMHQIVRNPNNFTQKNRIVHTLAIYRVFFSYASSSTLYPCQ